MRIALVGCGFVADPYVRTLAGHPQLRIGCVVDRDRARATRFGRFHDLPVAASLDAVCDDPAIDVVVNLTNPSSHHAVSRQALLAGKHVYSEKPLAMTHEQACELVHIAAQRDLVMACAPCSILGEAAQTVGRALRAGSIGRPRLVFAEINDHPMHLENFREWHSPAGTPWPWRDEFSVGCAVEHAAYYASWLVAFFGPATRVTSFAALLMPDKAPDLPAAEQAADFSVACIEFRNGVVARLTCGSYAPLDRGMRIIGDTGVLSVADCWDYGAPVRLAPRRADRRKLERHPLLGRALVRTLRPARRFRPASGVRTRMDFARGIAELAASIRERRPCVLGGDFALHVNEIVLSMQQPDAMGSPRRLTTSTTPPAEAAGA